LLKISLVLTLLMAHFRLFLFYYKFLWILNNWGEWFFIGFLGVWWWFIYYTFLIFHILACLSCIILLFNDPP
jgi:hypothetical protein